METTEKKTARQRFLRRSRALTLTISIPSLSAGSFKSSNKRSESVISLRRSQSTRDVYRHKLSVSENCLDKEDEVMSDIGGGCVSVINISGSQHDHRNNNINNTKNVSNTSSGFGYKLKRSLTVSHILDNINKSFRVRRSCSQRDVAAKKNKFRR